MVLKSHDALTSGLVQAATAHLDACRLCPHDCGSARADADGVCGVGRASFIASEMLHMGEESLLRPAHAIFFSGCTAKCRFCTAAKFAFRPAYGVTVSPAQLAQRMEQRQREGARAICFIGGEPAPHIPFILASLDALGPRKRVPAVFNSNFYLSDAALDLLEPAIDLYLPDLKFGPSDGPAGCGQRIGGMPDYWRVVTQAMDRTAARGGRLVVRHLLMPGHFACCTAPILAWLAQRPHMELSLLTQYVAPPHVKGALAECLDAADVRRANLLASQLGLTLVE